MDKFIIEISTNALASTLGSDDAGWAAGEKIVLASLVFFSTFLAKYVCRKIWHFFKKDSSVVKFWELETMWEALGVSIAVFAVIFAYNFFKYSYLISKTDRNRRVVAEEKLALLTTKIPLDPNKITVFIDGAVVENKKSIVKFYSLGGGVYKIGVENTNNYPVNATASIQIVGISNSTTTFDETVRLRNNVGEVDIGHFYINGCKANKSTGKVFINIKNPQMKIIREFTAICQ